LQCKYNGTKESVMSLCANCGELILEKPDKEEDEETDEHVPPIQFIPKTMRPQLRKQLWTVPSHKRCNESYKLDEEYFLHFLSPLVASRNQAMGEVLLAELKRRAKKPQSKGLIRRLLKEKTHTSPGGIILPPSVIRVNYDLKRIQNVAVKVAKCLFYRDNGRYIPRSSCVHCELCETPRSLQPVFFDLFRVRELERRSAAPDVFRYWYIDLDGQHHYALLFWEAFMFCMIFHEPGASPNTVEEPVPSVA
jgi:hypothetical protein